MQQLGLDGIEAYRAYLAENSDEWERLDAFCRIPISRFYRDREVFQAIEGIILPALSTGAMVRPDRAIRCWCAGCASGEEAYTLGIIWQYSVQATFPATRIEILGTDVDETVLRRAERACYAAGSLKDLPSRYLDRAFRHCDDQNCVKPIVRRCVRFERQDIRTQTPEGVFDLVMCRNSVFTYFETARQQQILGRINAHLAEGAILVIGSHERLPKGEKGYGQPYGDIPIYRRDGRAQPCAT
jgi:chemotaxis protein methyltransferase CheR